MSNKPKRYRLLKDLPDCNKGDVAEFDESYNCYRINKNAWVSPHRWAYLTKGQVEQSPEWFEEIKEPDKIEIADLGPHDRFLGNKSDTYWYQFSTNKLLDGTKFAAIKEAIERVLNEENEFDVTGRVWKITDLGGGRGSAKLIHPKYTQEELDKAIVDAFNAAREKDSPWFSWKFDSPKSYLTKLYEKKYI